MAIANPLNPNTEIADEGQILTVTPSAVKIIKNLLTERNIPNHALRVFVSGGGCSGMQYGMSFEELEQDYDTVVTVDGVRLLVDSTSLTYLRGATVDFVDNLIGGGFRIDNPNAVSSCGCGSSFRTSETEDTGSDAGCGSCSSY